MVEKKLKSKLPKGVYCHVEGDMLVIYYDNGMWLPQYDRDKFLGYKRVRGIGDK